MRGFQPGRARAVPQNYADGGVVSTIKGMLGFGKKKSEPLPADLNKMPPPAAGQAASQPEPPKKAISEYSGMSALERRMKAAGLADGGLVRGPGTGISDDIEDDVEEGTFIMPADSTEAIGPEVMDQAGKAVPVNLSNGEAKLPPEALQAIGAQVMEAIKDVTHVPAAKQARGFPMGERAGPELDADDGRMNFADGGVVDDKRRPRTVADLARSPGYGAGAGGPVSTPVRTQAPAARPQAAQPVPGVTRQGNSYSAAPVQGPLGSGMYQLDSNLPKPPNIQAQAQRPAAAPAQRPPAPAPVQAVQQPVQNPVQPRPVYTGSTVADRARQPGFGFAAGASTPAPPAQAAKVAPAAPVSQRVATPPSAQPAAPAQQPAQANTDTGVGKAFDAIGSGLGWLGKTLVSAPGHGLSNVVGQQPREVGGGRGFMSPDRANPAAPAPASPAAPPAVTQAADPAAPPQKPEVKALTAPAPGPVEVSPGVFRQGSSFGDSAAAATAGAQPSQGPSARNMAAMNNLIARDPVAGAMDRTLGVARDPAQASKGFPQGGERPAATSSPAPGAVSATEPAAASARGFQPPGQPTSLMESYARQSDALRGLAGAQRALDGNQATGGGGPYIKHSGNDWETANNLRNLRVSANSITAGADGRGRPSVEQAAYLKALDADMAARNGNNPAAIEGMRQQGESQRTGMREDGENTRSGRRDGLAAELGRGQLGLQRSAQGFNTRQGERQEKLYAEYEAAKTPEEQAAVARKIAALSGKEQPADWKVQVTPQTKNVDGSTTEGSVIRYNSRTGDVQRVDGTGGGGKPAKDSPQVQAIVNDTSLTLEQRREALRKLGFS